LQLGRDLGIYVVDKQGQKKGRLDAVDSGDQQCMACYKDANTVESLPWIKVQSVEGKDGTMVNQLNLDGQISASDVQLGNNQSVEDRLRKMQEQLDRLSQSVDTLVENTAKLSSAIRTGGVANTGEKEHYLTVDSDDEGDVDKWALKTSKEPDGRPSVVLCYDGTPSSNKFLFDRAPQSVENTQTKTPVNNASMKPHSANNPVIRNSPANINTKKSIASLSLHTPSDKKRTISAKKSRDHTEVETISIQRPKSRTDSTATKESEQK
jgi:hypothetical protein